MRVSPATATAWSADGRGRPAPPDTRPRHGRPGRRRPRPSSPSVPGRADHVDGLAAGDDRQDHAAGGSRPARGGRRDAVLSMAALSETPISRRDARASRPRLIARSPPARRPPRPPRGSAGRPCRRRRASRASRRRPPRREAHRRAAVRPATPARNPASNESPAPVVSDGVDRQRRARARRRRRADAQRPVRGRSFTATSPRRRRRPASASVPPPSTSSSPSSRRRLGGVGQEDVGLGGRPPRTRRPSARTGPSSGRG